MLPCPPAPPLAPHTAARSLPLQPPPRPRSTTTHVVVQQDSQGRATSRTVKYLRGVVAGCWVVGFDWVLASLAAGCWLEEVEYVAKVSRGQGFMGRWVRVCVCVCVRARVCASVCVHALVVAAGQEEPVEPLTLTMATARMW